MDENKYRQARKRVKKKKEFYSHLTSYLVMSAFFFLLNAATGFGNWWFYWPILGWGIGIAFHYFDAFGVPGVGPINREWEEQAIREEMKRLEEEDAQNVILPQEEEAEPNEELELKPLQKSKRKWDDSDLV